MTTYLNEPLAKFYGYATENPPRKKRKAIPGNAGHQATGLGRTARGDLDAKENVQSGAKGLDSSQAGEPVVRGAGCAGGSAQRFRYGDDAACSQEVVQGRPLPEVAGLERRPDAKNNSAV